MSVSIISPCWLATTLGNPYPFLFVVCWNFASTRGHHSSVCGVVASTEHLLVVGCFLWLWFVGATLGSLRHHPWKSAIPSTHVIHHRRRGTTNLVWFSTEGLDLMEKRGETVGDNVSCLRCNRRHDGWVGGRGVGPLKPPPASLVALPARRLCWLMTGGGTSVVSWLAPVNLFVDAAPPRRCPLLFDVSSHLPCTPMCCYDGNGKVVLALEN